MSIYYDLYENPDKEGTEEQKLLHARVVPSGTYTTKEFVERVSMMHHIPHAQLVGAVEAITDELQTLLSRGYIVEFGDLGHFSLTLSLELSLIHIYATLEHLGEQYQDSKVLAKNSSPHTGHFRTILYFATAIIHSFCSS